MPDVFPGVHDDTPSRDSDPSVSQSPHDPEPLTGRTSLILDEITFLAQDLRDDSDWEELRRLRVNLALLLASLIQGDY